MVVIDNETLGLIDQNIHGCNVASVTGKIVTDYIKSKNSHDNLTLALRSVKEDLKEILSHYPETFYFGQVHFNLLYEVFNEMGWEVDLASMDSTGWEYNVFMIVNIPGKDFYYHLNCGWFNPFNHLEKIYKNEAKSNNC